MQKLEIGEHWLVHMGSLQIHMDTMIMAWLSMLILIALSLAVTRNLNRIPDKIQTFAEMVMEFIESIAVGQIGGQGRKHIMLIGSLFLFILVANLLGQLPWGFFRLPHGELASPTNDLNVTAGLALLVTVYYLFFGISKKGLKFFKHHYFEPVWFMAPLNFLEDFIRPLTLSLRLFGNIIAGEVLVVVLLGFFPLFLPIPMMLFEIFVAFIQAFIFAILAASYIAAAIADHNET